MRRLVCLAMVGATLGLMAGCDDDPCSPGGFCSVAKAEFLETVPITTQPMYVLTGINGNVEIAGDDAATQLTVSGTRSVRSNSNEDAERRLKDLQVEISVEDQLVHIKTVQPEDTEGRSYTVDYKVVFPVGTMAQISTTNGNITATRAWAGSMLATVNGNIDAQDARGFASLYTINGNIQAAVEVRSDQDVWLRAVNGNLSLTIPTEASALVSAAVTNGVITVSGLNLVDLNQTDVMLSGRLGAGETEVKLQTANGNITLRGS